MRLEDMPLIVEKAADNSIFKGPVRFRRLSACLPAKITAGFMRRQGRI